MSKIDFTITPIVKNKIEKALRKYGDFEIGGILIGRKIGDESFEVVDISISNEDKRFSISSFIRGTKTSERLLRSHFRKKTGYYIGEWHSHPKYSLRPSYQDIVTMFGILKDENYGVSFAILIITHLSHNKMNYRGYFFHENINKIVELK